MINKLIPVVKELATNKSLLDALVTLSKIPCEMHGFEVEASPEGGVHFKIDSIKTGVKEDE